MYVRQTDACSVPNSATPVSSTKIASSQAFLAAINGLMDQANANFNALITRPDLNLAGQSIGPSPAPASGSTPAPTSGPAAGNILPFDSSPIPSEAQAPTRLASWPTMCVGNGTPLAEPTPREYSNIGVQHPKAPPLTLPPVGARHRVRKGPGAPAPAPAPAATPAKCGPMPTTGNVCIDLQKGYVLQQQVSPKQLQDCITKEYFLMGSHGRLTPAQQLCQNENYATLPHIADQPNVPKYDQNMGLAGVDTDRVRAWLLRAYRKG